MTRTVTFRALAAHGPALPARPLDALGGVLASGSSFPGDGEMVSHGPAS